TVGTADGEILVSLNTPHGPTAAYLKRLRDELPRQFPDLEFFAQPADIVSQILNFGLPAPIDIQVTGPLADSEKNYEVATAIAGQAAPQLLGNLADFHRTVTPLSLNHYNVQPVFDVYAGVQGRDLGSVASEASRIIAKFQTQLSKASSIVVRGQVLSMNQSF